MVTALGSLPASLSTPILIALVTLKGYQEAEKGKEVFIGDLAEYLVELKRNGVDISNIHLSGIPGEYWSEDVAQFVTEGVVFGFLKHWSPIEFTDQCVEVCRNPISFYLRENEEIKPLLEQAKNILNLEDPIF
ncbi:MAG: hypothetical protein Greene101415_322 [Parcubacteria group bacterium Greene1014_15]|nr:MAG: hypothetical protein Greene101415_322 [Parcubacteria group bacterium Greene1014_15]